MSLLVALDFSPVAEPQLEIAARLARPELPVHLLHVAEPDPSFVGFEAGPAVVRDQVAERFRKEREQLQAYAEDLRGRGLTVNALTVQGPTVETILEQAGKLDATLIVVGSHGRGALFDLVVGSVSSGVIRAAKVPVLVVPSR